MLPDLSLLLGLVLGLFAFGEAADGAPSPLFAAGGTATVVLVVAALARMSADRAIRAADEEDPERVLSATRRIGFLPILGWVTALFVFDWGVFAGTVLPPSWFFVPFLLLFLPLLLLFGITWAAGRSVEARLSPQAPTAWGAVARGLRRNLLVLAPLAILLGFSSLFAALATWDVPGVRTAVAWQRAFPDIEAAVSVLVLFGLGLLAPTLFRRTLRATPLPGGELRRDLEGLSKAIGLRCRDFLLWDTHKRVTNAMVVGITSGTRYVFLTDGLLSHLSRAEVVAVVAHEAGHAKERHLPLYFVVAVALVLLLKAAEEAGSPWLDPATSLWLTLAFLAVFWFGVLGWLSRRFEREADVFGADRGGALQPEAPLVETAGVPAPLPYGAALMIAVLRRLERLAGPMRHHRHAPPSERAAFLASYTTDPAVRQAFRRDRRTTRAIVFGLLAAALATTAVRLPGGIVRGKANLLFLEAMEDVESASAARGRGDAAAATAAARRARDRLAQVDRAADERPHDAALAFTAAAAAYNAAEIDRRRLGDAPAARAGFERSLRLLEKSKDPRAAEVRFHANVDLAILDLLEAKGDDDVARARNRLEAAKAVPEELYKSKIRSPRTRLVESALGLRDADAARAKQARENLEGQSRGPETDEEWKSLREDAAALLAAAPARAG